MDKLLFNKAFKFGYISEERNLADEIFEYFDRKLSYGVIRKFINEKGKIFVRETFDKVRKESKNPLGLFIWIIGKQEIVWK